MTMLGIANDYPLSKNVKTLKNTDLVLFNSSDGVLELNLPLEKETVWLSLNQISNLFERDKSVISRYIKKILAEELDRDQTVAFFSTVQKEKNDRLALESLAPIAMANKNMDIESLRKEKDYQPEL